MTMEVSATARQSFRQLASGTGMTRRTVLAHVSMQLLDDIDVTGGKWSTMSPDFMLTEELRSHLSDRVNLIPQTSSNSGQH